MTSIVLLLAACVVPCLSLPVHPRSSSGGVPGPDTSAAQTTLGAFANPQVLHHREAAISRVHDLDFTYPDQVQLVPNIPLGPQSPKYTLVPVRRPPTRTSFNTNLQTPSKFPTIPSDFADEIAKIQVPYNDILRLHSGPQPLDEEEDDDEYDEDDNYEENRTNFNYFPNVFPERPQFKHIIRAVPSPRTPLSNEIPQNGAKIVIKHRPEHTNPLVVTNYPPYTITDSTNYLNSPTPGEYRKVKQSYDFSGGHSPFCNEHAALQHYGPARPVPAFRQFNHSPMSMHQHQLQQQQQQPVIARTKRPRTYLRYPRNYRTYYHHPAPLNRVKVMTQSFVYHPTEYFRDLRNPVMMPSMPELRNVISPQVKRKKKKKKSKSNTKGECKPKKIIKEIHFHHYDPQLSAQLAPLEGINLKDGEDYENDIKVITKETEIEDDEKKRPEDYDEQYNQEVKKETEEQNKGSHQRPSPPDYYGESYNNQYSETGSMEYIDYNLQTDSSSSTLMHDPHPSHDFPDTKRSFRGQPTLTPLLTTPNNTELPRPPLRVPLNIGTNKKLDTFPSFEALKIKVH